MPGARVPAQLHRRGGESHGRPTGGGDGRGPPGAGPRPPGRCARSGCYRHERRRPRPDQVRPPGRWAGAPRRGDGHCPRRPARTVHLRHPLLSHHRGLSRGRRRTPHDPLDRLGRAVADHVPRGGVVRGPVWSGLSFCCSVANGTRPNRLRCGSWWTSTPAGSTMPRKPGTPLPRRAGCGATRAPPTRTTRRTPAGGTRNRDGAAAAPDG